MPVLRLYVDANAVIGLAEGTGDGIEALGRMLDLGLDGRLTLVSSHLVLGEVLVVPIADRNEALLKFYGQDLSRYVDLRDIDDGVIRQAAAIRAKWRTVKLPDALHLATAELTGCAVIVSADKRLPADFSVPRCDPATDLDLLLDRLP